MNTSRHVFLTFILIALAADAFGQALVPGTLLPQGDAAAGNAVPDLLPRTDAWPDRAPLFPDLNVNIKGGTAGPTATPFISEEQRREIEKRLAEVRLVAMQNVQAIAYLQQAGAALSVEARRNYLRAYYTTVCLRMRELEPRLAASIRAYEQSRIRAVGRSKDPRVPTVLRAGDKG